nr:fumarate/nitrate reduction transcriptional regulator Fnr [Solemya velum gill symbiont]
MADIKQGKIKSRESQLSTTLKDQLRCQSCGLTPLCLPVGMSEAETEKLDSIVHRNTPYHKGDHLFRQGDKFKGIYVITSGSVKSYYINKHGEECIVGFYLPGELIGLDAIHNRVYSCSVAVLETTSACEVPFSQLQSLTSEIPSLQHQLMCLLSKEVHNDCEMVAILASHSAEERLASFLLSLSSRYKSRSLSALEFNLSMSRTEIASFLGHAVETVSRTFSRFQEQGLLEVNRKQVKLLNIEALADLGDNTLTSSTTGFP